MAGEMDRRDEWMRRVGRMMQEKAENSRELADALHVWRARMLSNGSCCIMPGDYVFAGQGCMCSSRGAFLSMSESDLHAMIEGGALSKVFDFDDLNAPDFGSQLDGVMDRIMAQRHFRDASAYYELPGLERSVAVYDVPVTGPGRENGQNVPAMAVERNGDRFALRTGAWDGDRPVRQCSYEEFNPGGADIMQALQSEDKSSQGRNRSELFEKMQREYLNNGENEIVKPDDALKQLPGYDSMSPSQRLAAKVKLEDEYHRALERSGQQEQAQSTSDQWGPRLPGERRRY